MATYRVTWKEIRVHYIVVEADDDIDAIDLARDFSYGETASDTSWYDDFDATMTSEIEKSRV